jgi:predicted Zn-dependent peptidase
MMDDFKSVTLAELNALAAKYLGADTVATVVRVVASGGEAEKPGK